MAMDISVHEFVFWKQNEKNPFGQLATNKWMYGETVIFALTYVCPFSKVLQHILNPAFLHSFEKGEGEQLLGPPNPEGDNPDSITSVFITKVDIYFQTSS